MAFPDDLRKALTDPRPLYLIAGAGDLAASKLRAAPKRLAELRAQPQAVQDKVQGAIYDAQTKIAETISSVPHDVRALPEHARAVALSGFGRAVEAVGRAQEACDGLVDRGQDVLGRRFRGAQPGADSADEERQAEVKPDAAVVPAEPRTVATTPADGKPAAAKPAKAKDAKAPAKPRRKPAAGGQNGGE